MRVFFFFPPFFLVHLGTDPCCSSWTILSLMGIVSGRYRYLNDLQCLESCSDSLAVARLPRGPTPIKLSALSTFMRLHPDQEFATYIGNGLLHGFHVGFHRGTSLRQNWCNHPSSLDKPAVIQAHITMETQCGRLVGPLPPGLAEQVHVSPLGLVPKPHSDKWRMIVDLSAPVAFSVNDGIDADLCSLRYASVDDAVELIQRLGRDTQLVKMDLKDAYRVIPVHPDDHHLLGIRWQDQVFLDRSLPFGLRSAPKIFTAVADMVAWSIHCGGVRFILHYLDDFLILGAPGTPEAGTGAAVAVATLRQANIKLRHTRQKAQHHR